MPTHTDAHAYDAGLAAYHARGAAERTPYDGRDAELMAPMLEQLTGQIQARIAAVEQRHTDAFRDLQNKLERMSGTAGRAKPAMPSELSIAFGRIEAGMADLVDRIAETAPDRRRGADAFVFGAKKADSTHFVFNPPKRQPVAPISLGADPASADPWDLAAAAALADLYESGEAILAKPLPEAALFAPGQWARAAAAETAASADPTAAPVVLADAPPAPAAAILVAGLGDDRDWLEQRLAGIAEQLSKSIGDARPDGALQMLMSRVDQLETRFTSALDGIATKSDIASMRGDALLQVEAQIKELAGHIESTHQQLTRLDSIEQHLSDLTAFAHASMDAEHTPASESLAAVDYTHSFAELADIAVERALARASAPPSRDGMHEAAETQARVDAVHALLQEFSAERRRGDQYTTGMLETVQEALIRLIDRVDTIDAQASRRAAAIVQSVQQPEPAIAGDYEASHEPSLDAVSNDIDVQAQRTPKRRVKVAIEQPSADITLAAAPTVDIKDIRLPNRRVEITTPDVAAPGPTSAADAQPKAASNIRKSPATAATGASGKQGMYVAALALSLVGVGFMAQHLYSSGEAVTPALGAAPNKPATTAAASSPIAPTSSAASVPVRPIQAPSQLPPGMMPAQPRVDTAQPLPRAGVTMAPSARDPSGPRSDAKSPPSTPETVSDDLSMLETEEPSANVEPAAVPNEASPTQQIRKSVAALLPMQGLVVAPAYPVQGLPQVADIANMQRQSNQAAASERLGFAARPASDFSQRFSTEQFAKPTASPAAANAAPAMPAAAIVTGSTSAPRAGLPSTDASLTETSTETADLPPALVGPLSLRMAAAKGEPSAAFEVATRFAEGRGIKQDFKQAMIWYQRAANKGFAIAQYRLGTLFERGLGTPIDLPRARGWYKKAADQGNVKAMHNMAVLSAGNGQSAPDYASAAKWFKDAAERGLPDSQFNLGVLYENGLGVVKDTRTAYVWFALAARNGDAEAVRRRDAVLATMDAAAAKSANDQLLAWHARATDTKINDPRVAGDQWRNHAAVVSDQQTQLTRSDLQPAAAPEIVAGPLQPQPRTIKVPQPPR